MKSKSKIVFLDKTLQQFEGPLGFRLLSICSESSPVTCLYFIIPTKTNNHKGLPHTLEHLIFFGSEKFPLRGHLDSLALQHGSTGTNAFTTEDHTGYYVAVATDKVSSIGSCFLHHVLSPSLTESAFTTEVSGDIIQRFITWTKMEAKKVLFFVKCSQENTVKQI